MLRQKRHLLLQILAAPKRKKRIGKVKLRQQRKGKRKSLFVNTMVAPVRQLVIWERATCFRAVTVAKWQPPLAAYMHLIPAKSGS